MKIAMDARGANLYKGTGIGTYTEKLLKNLINIDKENLYTIYWCGENYNSLKKSNTKIKLASKKHHRFFETYYFPASIEKEGIDLYHVPQNGMGIQNTSSSKKICTIHDLIPYNLPETVGKG